MSTRSEQAVPARPAGHSARHGHAKPDPHVIVLFGATGDLAKRKLLPGLLPPVPWPGCCPSSSAVIGSAPPEFALSDDDFREHAEAACNAVRQLQARRVLGLVRRPAVVRRGVARGPVAAGGRGRGGGEGDQRPHGHRTERAHGHIGRLFHLAVPPSAFASVVTMLGSSGWPTSTARVIIEKPFGTDLESSQAAQRGRARGVRRVADLPHRPLPRQGVGRQHPRLPVRQRAVRADLEPAPHQVRADRRAGDADRRGAGRRSTTRPAPTGTWW